MGIRIYTNCDAISLNKNVSNMKIGLIYLSVQSSVIKALLIVVNM